MRRRLSRLLPIAALCLGGCTGQLSGDGSPADAAPDAASPADVGRAPMDVPPPRDVPPAPRDVPAAPVDRGVVRDVPPAPLDRGAAPVDVGVPARCAAGPLATPIAGCRPPTAPSTGDPRQDCVDRINQFRRECQCLPPLQRWTAGEACADNHAMIDQQTRTAHNGFRMRVCSNSGSGQNECPGWLGWGSVASTVSGCLQQMWDEGPGDFYGPPPHGHYLNMSSRSFTRVACGYFTSGGATTAVQNFQ
ncbi:MAG: hypothetical protein Q8S73_03740 [Deltaproteobacteria bacterium]|nr:hypothetical protein [Myxococcales bacterium]MDP3213192.1 hypothetical protein [Deltaproteobacteria bacterium]